MNAITTHNLSKNYKTSIALSEVNFKVATGEIVGCLGPAGSGKTTVIKLLAGVANPTSGWCSVLGLSPSQDNVSVHKQIGIITPTSKLYGRLTVDENLRFFAQINGMQENDIVDRISFLCKVLNLREFREDKVSTLRFSLHFRASLARAAMCYPKVLLIDEPETGLDMETLSSVEHLCHYMSENEGTAVLLSTKDLLHASRICEKYIFLSEGRLIADGTLAEIQSGTYLKNRISIKIGDEDSPPQGFRFDNGSWIKEIGKRGQIPSEVIRMVQSGLSLFEVKMLVPTLEDVYKAYFR